MLYLACGIGLWAVVVLSTWWAVHIEASRILRRLRRIASELDAVAANVAEVRWLVESEEDDDGQQPEPSQAVEVPTVENRESVSW